MDPASPNLRAVVVGGITRFKSVSALAAILASLLIGHAPGRLQADEAGVTVNGSIVEEFWETAHIGEARVGYAFTQVLHVERDGVMLRVEVADIHFTTTRFGEPQQLVIRDVLESTLDGQLIRMIETMESPAQPVTTLEAVVEGSELKLTVTTGDEVEEQRIPWDADLAAGMQFSSEFDNHAWQPDEEVATTEYTFMDGVLSAKYFNRGEVELQMQDGSARTLLHIEKQETIADGSIQVSNYYIEPGVGAIKQEFVSAELRTERVTREVAERTDEPMHESGTVIEVSLPESMSPADLYLATALTYQLTLAGISPSMLPKDLRQTVVPVDEDTVQVLVTANPVMTHTVTDEELQACSTAGDYVDFEDALLKSLAVEGIEGAETPLDKALALEVFVGEYVADDYQHLFDSASQVALSKAGDCSEHSVLLVSLLRLNGIPARVAAGLVIDSTNQQALGHMWVEAYIDGNWIALDAIRSMGGILPAYIKFADWNLLENETDPAQFIRAVGIWQSPIEIEVVEFEMAE
jgi:hypothetical protein